MRTLTAFVSAVPTLFVVLAACAGDAYTSVYVEDDVRVDFDRELSRKDHRTVCNDADPEGVRGTVTDGVLTLTASERATDRCTVYVRDDLDTLWLRHDGPARIGSAADARIFEVRGERVVIEGEGASRLEIAELSVDHAALDLGGDATVLVGQATVDRLDTETHGQAALEIDLLIADAWEADLGGTSEVWAHDGSVRHLDLDARGDAWFDAEGVVAGSVEGDVTGNAEVRLTSDGDVDVEATGNAVVTVNGDLSVLE